MGSRGDDCRQCSAADLAIRALAGRVAAWDEIVRRHSHRVRLSLLARGIPWETSEDLVQETWMRLIRQQRAGRLRSLERPGLAIAQAGWLAREAARGEARRREIAPIAAVPACDLWEVPGPDGESDPAQLAERRDRKRAALEVLAECPPRMRQVVERAYADDGGTHADVARELGLSVQRVRQTLCEARSRLRRALASLEREDRS